MTLNESSPNKTVNNDQTCFWIKSAWSLVVTHYHQSAWLIVDNRFSNVADNEPKWTVHSVYFYYSRPFSLNLWPPTLDLTTLKLLIQTINRPKTDLKDMLTNQAKQSLGKVDALPFKDAFGYRWRHGDVTKTVRTSV